MSHPLKKVRHNAGSMGFSYELDVLSWSKTDFSFTYVVPDSSSHISGGVLLESPLVDDFDQREIKDVVFVIDISGSMQGKLMDDTKNALSVALAKLDLDDSFSIIAFNGEIYHFSKSMELVSKDAVERAIEWINMNFIAGGDTNILYPLNMAIRMLSDAQSSVPIIFLVKDGIVEDERQICDMIKNHMTNAESISPRIYTFGIDLIEPQMLKLFEKASSLVLANITMGIFNDVDEVEVCPSHIPDLSSDGPLLLSGRYKGSFSKDFEIKGVLPVFSNFVIDMKIQDAKDIPVQRICARDQIEYLTAQAWLSKDEKLEQKSHPQSGAKEQGQRIILLPPLGIGFGNLTATTENIQPGSEETKGPDGVEIFVKASINCCGTCCNNFCCMCCIQVCTQINNQCAIAFTQLCVGLGCFICLNCCADICCSGNEN
ncbi:von Willebrand factor A domain-containing protein 5B1 [Glycine soja]